MMIILDGSHGEGAGQILRASLALSLPRHQSRRPVSGLSFQHSAVATAPRPPAQAGNGPRLHHLKKPQPGPVMAVIDTRPKKRRASGVGPATEASPRLRVFGLC
jgi:hypothetical protein